MVRVVDVGPHKSVVKEVVCHKCGATLEYAPIDLKEGYSTDYTGGRDFYKYIACPQCNNKITVQ